MVSTAASSWELKRRSECAGDVQRGGLTESRGVVPSGPSVGGGGGAPPALPVGSVGAFVLREAAQAALEVAVSWQGGGQRGCGTKKTIKITDQVMSAM